MDDISLNFKLATKCKVLLRTILNQSYLIMCSTPYIKGDFRNKNLKHKNLRRLSLGIQTKLCYNTAIICRITIGMVVINIIMIAVVIIWIWRILWKFQKHYYWQCAVQRLYCCHAVQAKQSCHQASSHLKAMLQTTKQQITKP